MADFFTVTSSFIGLLNKQEVTYIAGEVVPADDPARRKWPQHFAPLVVRGQVEQATAAPGEKRMLGKPKAQPKAKASPASEPEPAPELTLEPAPEPAPEPSPEPEPAAGQPVSLSGLKGRDA